MPNLFKLRKEKLNNSFEPPDGWLGCDGNANEWAVAFHGVKETTGNFLGKIIVEGMKPGDR